MVEAQNDARPGRSRDRKLGDEWADWDANSTGCETDIDEKKTTFIALACGVIFIFFVMIPAAWYFVKPRFDQINPLLSRGVEWTAFLLGTAALILALTEGVCVVKFRRSLLPYAPVEKILLSLLPKTVWLGSKFGISRDRVGNSFIKVHNFVTRSYAGRLKTERLLILLPRCLKKDARNRLMERIGDNALIKALTVAGGEEAREAIRQHRPDFILALACERDLMSGIKDVAEKIPVLAIPNKRPEGPCKNTEFSFAELEDALTFFSEGKKQKFSLTEVSEK